MTAKTFRELRAWQTAYAFKLRIYELIESGLLSNDETLRKQLRESAASAASQISEGFGRFDPVDFARFVKMARASILECKNHLQDAVDRRHISDDVRREHEIYAQEAMKGLEDYSITCSRQMRKGTRSVCGRNVLSGGRNGIDVPEPRTPNPEP